MASTTSGFRPRTCRFCGRTIQPKEVRLSGAAFQIPGSCDCDGARAQRAADEEAERRERAARLAELRRAIYRAAGIRPRFMGAVPDPANVPHVETGGNLYIVGDTDAGKTHAATALVKAYIDAHVREAFGGHLICNRAARIINVPDLMSEWKATYDGSGTEEDVTRRYGDADLLVLDDMGKGAPTAWALERLFQIVNRRYDNLRPTVVTTQYEPPALGRRLAETGDRETARAIVRRLTCGDTRRILLTKEARHG